MEGGELRGNFFDGDIYFHAACAYTKRLFDQVGGYGWYNCGEDYDFEYRLRSNETLSESCRVTRLPLERLYYIRRWGHGYYHAPYHSFYPHPYNYYFPGRGYYHGGSYSVAPERSGISASSPSGGIAPNTVNRGGFARSSSSHTSSAS